MTMAGKRNHICNLDEKKISTLISELLQQEFEKQKQDIITSITVNFESLNEEIKLIKGEINDLKQSIEHTENVLEEKVKKNRRKN